LSKIENLQRTFNYRKRQKPKVQKTLNVSKFTVFAFFFLLERKTTEMNTFKEIEELEIQLASHPNNVNNLCRLAELYLGDGRINKVGPLVNRALESYLLTVTQGVNVYEISLRYWKAERYSNKKSMRINTTKERKDLLNSIHQVVLALVHLRDPKQAHLISYKAAYIKECLGEFQDSLSLLSDLIAAQAVEGIDFNFVIFKAAVMLKHLGQHKQAIEYLEYIEDDPPVEAGYTKTHVLAFLILVYEQSEEKYKVFLSSTYKKLIQSCVSDAEHASSNKQFRKLVEIAQNKNLYQSSELWEVLAIHAIDRCEYLLGLQFLNQAIIKAPGKGSLLQWAVEIYYLLGDLTKASKYGEKAQVLLPQSIELRNLLILIDPDKWTEKLRFISPTKAEQREGLRSPSRKFREESINNNNNNTVSLGLNTSVSNTVHNNNLQADEPVPTGYVAKATTNNNTKPNNNKNNSKNNNNNKTNKNEETTSPNDGKDNNPNNNGNNWLSKITNSAATAIHVRTRFFVFCFGVVLFLFSDNRKSPKRQDPSHQFFESDRKPPIITTNHQNPVTTSIIRMSPPLLLSQTILKNCC
jgi:tetratricopeptide (TPR) repeat protein